MVHCLCNRILRVDLGDRKIRIEPAEGISEKFLGGRGINQKILFDEWDPSIHAFDEQSLLAIGAGLLVGTMAPCASRLSIDSKSAFSQGIGSANMGGYFAAELKRAGFDHVILTGRADRPVYLWIHDGDVEFKDASEIWMKDTLETEAFIR